MGVHTDDVVGVTLQKLLLTSLNVLADQYATSTVVDLVTLVDQIGVVKGGK